MKKQNPKLNGWYLATYGNFTDKYYFLDGKWYVPTCFLGEEVLQRCDNPDNWKRI